jgi:uncharacterized protein YecE (DUF72 family)
MPDLRIGISGWTYAPWRGVFFPPHLVQKRELEFASKTFNSIEINGTFYSSQRPTSFAKWYAETPDDFVFSIKGGQFITHIRRLKDCEIPLANFFAQGILTLKGKLGPILWQLSPSSKFDAERIESFLELLPHDAKAAAALAKKHDARMEGKTDFTIDKNRSIRHAMEVRHESFRDPAFVALLRKHNVALVVADTAGRYPVIQDATADFMYLRLHGDEVLYSSGYSEAALDAWAKQVKSWAVGNDDAPAGKRVGKPLAGRKSGRDVYAYFDNDVKVRSPFDAAALAKRLGVSDELPKPYADLDAVTEEVRNSPPTTGRRSTAKARSMEASHRRVTPKTKTSKTIAKKTRKRTQNKAD